jgi:7,8-dihydroneopterin aldolase/epimerase/oxygenase
VLGWVELQGLRCWGRHGVYPEEQASERLFLVDVAVRTEVGRPASSDDLSDALDLACLAQTVREVVAGPPRKLLESLAVAAAALVLQRFAQAVEVKVRVRKPDPPGIEAAEEAVAVELAS